MSIDTDRIQATVEERLAHAEPEVELLALEQVAAERLRLYIDHPDGVDLDTCERVTGHLRDLLTDWGLEVSSPGPERPLTKPQHFRRFLGQRVRVKTRESIDGQRSFTGALLAAGEEAVDVETGAGVISIPLANVRRSNLVPKGDGGFPPNGGRER